MKGFSCKVCGLTGIIFILLLFPLHTSAAIDDEVQFTFAQPPVTAPIEEGESSNRINLTYLHLDMDNAITGRGVNFLQKHGQENTRLAWNVGTFVLDDEDDIYEGFMVNGGMDLEINLGSSRHSILFFGWDMSLMGLNMDLGTSDAYYSQFGLGLRGGFQQHIPMGRVVLTPYITLSGNYAAYYIETDFTDYDDDYTYSTAIIGFDFMLPGGVSLASALRTGGDDDMTLIQVGWNF